MEINEAAKRCHYSWLRVSSRVSRVTKWSCRLSLQGKWGQMAVQAPARPSCHCLGLGSVWMCHRWMAKPRFQQQWTAGIQSWGGDTSALLFSWADWSSELKHKKELLSHIPILFWVLYLCPLEIQSIRAPRHPWGHPVCSCSFPAICVPLSSQQGWHQESVQLRSPLVMWPVANVYRSLEIKAN